MDDTAQSPRRAARVTRRAAALLSVLTVAGALAATTLVNARSAVAPVTRAAGQMRIDFDGDGKTDPAVVRQIGPLLVWFISQSSNQVPLIVTWGFAYDVPVPGDYDGDGITDIATFRLGTPGTWYIRRSSDLGLTSNTFGPGLDVPTITGDYDGDGKDDLSIYRIGVQMDSQSTWFVRQTSNNSFLIQPFGLFGDVPVPGDYDGDAKTDVAVKRGGVFYLLQSTAGFATMPFGLPTDTSVVGDYDGDGKDDVAVTRDAGGTRVWWIRRSTDGVITATAWGIAGDVNVPGDYDGDGLLDVAVWRPSNGVFYARRSTNGTLFAFNWGASGDFPLANVHVH